MLSNVYDTFADPTSAATILASVAAAAAVVTIGLPFLERDKLGTRMKAVSTERNRIRARERERLANGSRRSIREEPKAYMLNTVERFNLQKWLGTDKAKLQLSAAGFRGRQAEIAFLFFRLIAPICIFLLTTLYIFVILQPDLGLPLRIGICISSAYVGIKAPELYLSNVIAKRRTSLRRAFPDTLDLLLICVESGMSVEHAIRKVSKEIGPQSIPMAEELTLTAAELSYLSDRRQAFENLGARTQTDGMRSISTVLTQAEQYGTPLGTALRVLAQESRDMRMLEAEKKAAGLPPKLTVPMILFFLPVLFVIIATPAVIQVLALPPS